MKLPSLPYSGNYKTTAQTEFRGLNANPGAKDGEIIAMTNLTGELYPLLATRKMRGTTEEMVRPRTLWAEDDMVTVHDGKLAVNGVGNYTVADSPKVIARMLRKLIIFPDKKIFDLDTSTLSDMEASASFSGVTFQNGTIFGEAAEANTIYKSGADWGETFKEGDAITISGATTHPENNKTPIIREIDGDYLRFYEYVFTLDPMWAYSPGTGGLAAGTYHFTAGSATRQFTISADLPYGAKLQWDGSQLTRVFGGSTETISTTSGSGGNELSFVETATKPYTESGTLTFRREVPELDYICVNENRLWGCKGDTIYASKLGDPTNFYTFDGLSTDSWSSEVGDKGDFTACISYLGYPMFFKENSVIKVYGDKPSNFQWTPSARFGVAEGSHLSLAVANETLFYLSPSGIVAYSGGIPTVISQPLGVQNRWSNAVAGSDGLRYYVSMEDQTGAWSVYVYDTKTGMWHREDAVRAVGFAYWERALYMLTSAGKLQNLLGTAGTPETASGVPWEVEFADTTEGSPMKKGVLRLLIRFEMLTAGSLTVSIQYDEQTIWAELRTMSFGAYTDKEKQSYVVPVIVRRCDHWRLKLSGYGRARIYSIAQTRYIGSEKQNW